MATLDGLTQHLRVPYVLRFPYMALRGRDHAPLVIEGSGEVHVPSLLRFEYILSGVPIDLAYALSQIQQVQDNPYDGLSAFRLIGTDADGLEWSLGWTIPTIEVDDEGTWRLRGDLEGLSPHVEGDDVAQKKGTEVTFVVPTDHPIAYALGRLVITPTIKGRRQHTFELNVLGTTVQFAYVPSDGILSINVDHCEFLAAGYAENWLGEPLRILFGQLVYPRLVARNLGAGKTIVFIRRSPGFVRGAGWAALWPGDDTKLENTAFWQLYADLLTFVAMSRDEGGALNWEANKVTALYVEIIQAARGTRWVWALTFASAIEGLLRILSPRGIRHPEANDDGIKALTAHIVAWPDKGVKAIKRLKTIAIGAVKRSAELPAVQVLRSMKNAGTITSEQMKAWEKIRNAVMHGSLVSPYSSAEDDAQLMALAGLVHILTRTIILRANNAVSTPAKP